jgi:hypothetical protein
VELKSREEQSLSRIVVKEKQIPPKAQSRKPSAEKFGELSGEH